MYWFLVMRSDLKPARNDLSIVKGAALAPRLGSKMGLRAC